MLRGIERRRIFRDTIDYEAFAARLDRLLPELGVRCFAWALMPNHAHLALQTGPVPLSRLMARLGTGYARYFNRRHHRVGHLFQNRYRSRLVEDEIDLQGLVVYIHRNPLEAGLVLDLGALEHFPWCGHGACLGSRPARPFEASRATQELFGPEPAIARRNLLVRMGASQSEDRSLSARPPDPVESRRSEHEPGRMAAELEDLITTVCRTHAIPRTALGRGARSQRIVRARTELVHRAVRELGLPSRTVARALGVSDATISRALNRFLDPPP